MISKLKIIANYILLVVGHTLLIIPLIWFVNVWAEFIFDYHIYNLLGLTTYDDLVEYTGDGLKPSGDIPESFILLLTLFGTPTLFFIGTIYTALKKMWWWFAAYIVLGFGFWIRLQIG